MQAFGMLLLAAATAGDGFGYGEPGVGHKHWLRSHVVTSSDATGPPPYTANSLAGPGGAGAQSGRRFMNTKSQIYFLDPNGMQIGWQNGTGPNGERTYLPSQLTVPARYNFNQGFIYRLKITNIPGRAGKALYPTIEVAPTTPATDAYLAHNAIPVQLTAEDFDQVIDGGNFVTKVIYLPDPKYQELAVSGRRDPGLHSTRAGHRPDPRSRQARHDPSDLEARGHRPGDARTRRPWVHRLGTSRWCCEQRRFRQWLAAGADLPPGALPPGFTPTPPPAAGTVVLDPAAAAPALLRFTRRQPPLPPCPRRPFRRSFPGVREAESVDRLRALSDWIGHA